MEGGGGGGGAGGGAGGGELLSLVPICSSPASPASDCSHFLMLIKKTQRRRHSKK